MVAIDGILIEREESPGTPEELAELMKNESQAETVMVPVGGGTQLHLGNKPRSAQLAIHTTKMRGVIEYEPDNMTVSLRSGTTLAELQEVLREGNQFLPLDPPRPSRATLGGIIACNSSGPIRFRYGTVRDMLIGVKIVHADGTRTKAGGKLVKNVTGYDMCKLYTGSLGTLGILSELTFKVQPRSESLSTVFIEYPSLNTALEATQLFLKSDLLPDALEAWNNEAIQTLPDLSDYRAAPWCLIVRFGDVEAAVRWQFERLTQIAPGSGGRILRVMTSAESERFWDLAASAREIQQNSDDVLVKCSVLYQSTPETALRMEEGGKRLGARVRLFCHAGTYVLYGLYFWQNGRESSAEELRDTMRDLRAHCRSVGGHTMIEKVDPEIKNGLDVWGYDLPALEIMRRIKKEFDPKGLLNPGRFVGGI